MLAYEGCGDGYEGEDEGSAGEDVAEWADEDQAAGVTGLHEGGDGGGFFEGYVEGFGDAVEDGLVVVEVGDGEAGCLDRLNVNSCPPYLRRGVTHKRK